MAGVLEGDNVSAGAVNVGNLTSLVSFPARALHHGKCYTPSNTLLLFDVVLTVHRR